MSRQAQRFWAMLTSAAILCSGCLPKTKTYYFFEDGDLSHYKGVATEIDYPDVEADTLDEVKFAGRPRTLLHPEDAEFWDVTLESVIKIALANTKVVRFSGASSPASGGVAGGANNRFGSFFIAPSPDDTFSRQSAGSDSDGQTIYDSAIQETNTFGITRGVAAALSDFDAQVTSSILWEKNNRPINVRSGAAFIFAPIFIQERATFQAQVAKTAANGSQFFVRNNVIYDQNTNPTRQVPSDYTVNYEVGVTQPLFQGAGTLFNRIAGPNSQSGFYQGVMIARLNNDVTLASFEARIRNMVFDLEKMYWELQYAYRQFDQDRINRDNALENWQRTKAITDVGGLAGGAGGQAEGNAFDLTQAENQYFTARASMEGSWTEVLRQEFRIRQFMGLTHTDHRLIRPIDEPTTARVSFDWKAIHCEALARNVNLRQRKFRVKRYELELLASRNFLLPRLDAVALYRWLGVGDQLISQSGRGVITPQGFPGSNAYSTLLNGDFQEWQLGFNFRMPLGFRKELAGVRNAQLRLAREQAYLQAQELEVSHNLAESLQQLESWYVMMQTRLNGWYAAEKQVRAVRAVREVGEARFNDVIRSLNLRNQASKDYYRALATYNEQIAHVHFRKGSLLDYNGIYLAEGPWPHKAYKDAHLRARERDAAMYMDYGFTRPDVVDRGPYQQFIGPKPLPSDALPELQDPTEAAPEEVPGAPSNAPQDNLPAPAPAPADSDLPNSEPVATEDDAEARLQLVSHLEEAAAPNAAPSLKPNARAFPRAGRKRTISATSQGDSCRPTWESASAISGCGRTARYHRRKSVERHSTGYAVSWD